MPTVAIVDGVRVVFYFNEHPPPHFHVVFAEYRAIIDIGTLEMIRGELPRAKLHTVLEWATPRRDHLLLAWEEAQSMLPPQRIE